MKQISCSIVGLIPILIGMAFLFYSCTRIEPVDVQPNITTIELPETFNVDKILFINDQKGFAAGGAKNTNGSIYMTSDGGTTWLKSYENDSLSINDMAFYNDLYGFACGDSMLLLKTIDGGLTWQQYNFPNLPYPEYRVPYNSVYILDSLHIFLAGGENYYKGLTSELEPGEEQWAHHSFDNEVRDAVFIDEYVGFFACYGQVLVTEDGGNTFTYLDIEDEYFYDLEYFEGQIWLLGRYGKLFSSADLGNTWNLNTDFREMTLRDLYLSETDSYICGDNGLLYLSRDKAQSWQSIDGFDGANLNSISVNPSGEVWIGADEGKVFVLNRRRSVQ
jgi:hypothetical protein